MNWGKVVEKRGSKWRKEPPNSFLTFYPQVFNILIPRNPCINPQANIPFPLPYDYKVKNREKNAEWKKCGKIGGKFIF